MSVVRTKKVAIVDYGVGNLFSVKHACDVSGLSGIITSSAQMIEDSDAIILPGVGAFGSAMDTLEKKNLISGLIKAATSGKPFIGICLGMQLLLEQSHEFGLSKGLGIIKGEVKSFQNPLDQTGKKLKIPHVGWNRICATNEQKWKNSLFHSLPKNIYMYFVHSYCAHPKEDIVLTKTTYGNEEFCSSFQKDNIIGCQFHPEKSGVRGLDFYLNLARDLQSQNSSPIAV